MAPSRAAPRPDAAGTSTAYSGTPSTSASSCRQPVATVPPPASRRRAGAGPAGPSPAGPSRASRASRIANAVPSSADLSSDARSLASASEDHDPRSDGSQYGVRSPVRCGTKIGSPDEPEEPDAPAYSSSHDAFSTSRTQLRLSPALSVAPIWYQPDGEASRNR